MIARIMKPLVTMRIPGLIVLLLCSFVGLNAQDTEKAYGPLIVWEKSSHDLGDVVEGEKVEHTFRFRNEGNAPLIITNVQVTCGRTTPKGWTKDPVAPGASAEITIGFDSAHKIGRQNKVVTIVSNAANADKAAQIMFSANVLEKKVPNEP